MYTARFSLYLRYLQARQYKEHIQEDTIKI